MTAAPYIAATLEPPYYAVIFTSVRTDKDESGYAAMAERMAELAAGQPGFLGMESVRERWYHQYRVRVARVERE